jgi:hypothetical protein
MKNDYIFLGTASEEINKNINNDSNIREDNEKHYLYPQYLYQLLFQKKNVNFELIKPDNMDINKYNYEWTRVFHTIFSKIIVYLREVCNGKRCTRMTAGVDWEFKYMSRGNKATINCSAIDYCLHTLDADMSLLSNPSFFSVRNMISDYSPSKLVKMVKFLYRIFAHILYYIIIKNYLIH